MIALKPRICLGFLMILAAAGTTAQPAPPVTERVQVTASRLPAPSTVPRRTIVLEREQIARLPVHSVQELLLWLAGAGVARRGAFGVQADAQLRGATFEEVAVLVDGIRVNDPQTGHFHLDVPLPLDAVERVEVTLGPGSAVHGPDAFGGVIAIRTRRPEGAAAHIEAGEHRLASGSFSAPVGNGAWVSASGSSTAGFRPDTELAITRAAAGWDGTAEKWHLKVTAAAQGSRFGAWMFYSPIFPNEREQTDAALLTVTAETPVRAGTLTLRAGTRQHDDLFILERTNPDFYMNRHRTRSGELQATLTGETGAVSWALGVEGERQTIASSRLGDHGRDRAAGFAEAALREGRWTFSAQARADHTQVLGWELSPAAGAAVDLGDEITLAAHVGSSFRLPSFTDLYYVSPGNVGNPDLHAERAWTGEVLARAPLGPLRVELAAFRRQARDLIDYVLDDAGVYRATNYARVVTRGAEVAASVRPGGSLEAVRVSAAWLSSDVNVDPSRSRYALSHPRLEIGAQASLALPFGFASTIASRFRRPAVGGSFAVVDLELTRSVGAGLTADAEVTNLFDRQYQEIDGVPMPGRWVSLGLTWRPHGS